MDVREVMTSNPRTVSPNDNIQAAARIMKEMDTGAVPIVEGDRAVGIITDRDIAIRAVAEGAYDRPVRECATMELVTVSPDTSTRDAERIMGERQVRRLLVVEDGRLCGIVSIGDIAVKEGSDRRTGDTLENISQGVKH
jgi:CBS domain-containing protein